MRPPPLQPDSYPIGGARMAFDAAPRFGRRMGRDEYADPAEAVAHAADPASALLTYIDERWGLEGDDRAAVERLISALVSWDGKGSGAEDIARRVRAADAKRRTAAMDSVLAKFPDLSRIRIS